tara:strand:+ start:97 stop:573 length:477 start_codon:yes stop_codon:yes gene_type:complete
MKELRNHYLLMKRDGFTASGELIGATESALALLDIGFWPLFKRTPCRKMVKPGQKALIYLAGRDKDCQRIIASVTIESIAEWSKQLHAEQYPLMLDDIPNLVLNFSDIQIFKTPVLIKEHLDKLDLVPKQNPAKWGMAMVGGMKSLSDNDYRVLSGSI